MNDRGAAGARMCGEPHTGEQGRSSRTRGQREGGGALAGPARPCSARRRTCEGGEAAGAHGERKGRVGGARGRQSWKEKKRRE
jgi:hypothetical protein